MQLGFELEDGYKIGCINKCFVFGPLRGGEATFVRPFAERFDPGLHWLIDTKGNETPSRFRVEAKAQGFQESVKPGDPVHALKLIQSV
jgi:hypothetical protein